MGSGPNRDRGGMFALQLLLGGQTFERVEWGIGGMRRQAFASAAALALFMTFDGGGFAVAQEAGGGTSGTPQTTTPPATTCPGPASGPDYYSADHDPADHYSYSHNPGPDHSARSTGHQASRGAGHSGATEAEAETGQASKSNRRRRRRPSLRSRLRLLSPPRLPRLLRAESHNPLNLTW